jgi:hypothetical protein
LRAGLLVWLCAATACSTAAEVAATVLTLGLGAAIPGHDLRQVYYVGVLDPEEQVQPALYRITVRGEASVVNSVKFASGWVDARLVDSLETNIRFDDDGDVSFGGGHGKVELETGRPMWMFGPEGFRKAPRNHRLVIAMGADPSAFFAAVDQVLGEMALAKSLDRGDASAQQRLELLRLVDQQQRETKELDLDGGGT